FSASGPSGILASSFMCRTSDADDAGEHRDRERDVADHDDPGDAGGEIATPGVETGVVPTHGLEEAPGSVEQVEAEGQVGDDVDGGDPDASEAVGDVRVGGAAHERVAGAGPAQVEQVPDDEEADDDARDPHGAAGEVRGDV